MAEPAWQHLPRVTTVRRDYLCAGANAAEEAVSHFTEEARRCARRARCGRLALLCLCALASACCGAAGAYLLDAALRAPPDWLQPLLLAASGALLLAAMVQRRARWQQRARCSEEVSRYCTQAWIAFGEALSPRAPDTADSHLAQAESAMRMARGRCMSEPRMRACAALAAWYDGDATETAAR